MYSVDFEKKSWLRLSSLFSPIFDIYSLFIVMGFIKLFSLSVFCSLTNLIPSNMFNTQRDTANTTFKLNNLVNFLWKLDYIKKCSLLKWLVEFKRNGVAVYCRT